MIVPTDKIKCIDINKELIRRKYKIQGKITEQVFNYKHLCRHHKRP